ncbi:general odorant-binding protein 56a [Halyomorpha halys]|uniref:general odorant-binding protein 56a n=1 Tax=Halyomorpha halys TaxID=286706 RepID=UPI0006D50EB3|nr:general odorant-binding protein 56a-like [Halyomorpha halys]KAE8573018.1 Odorant-binding protein 32 [Halyomorpha halys]
MVSVASPIIFFLGLSVVLSLTPSEWDLAWQNAEAKCEHLMRIRTVDKKAFMTKLNDVPRRAKCFVSCFFDEVGLTNGTEINDALYTGWLQEELAHSKNKKAIISSVKQCVAGIKKIEKCQTAFSLYECFGKRYFT